MLWGVVLLVLLRTATSGRAQVATLNELYAYDADTCAQGGLVQFELDNWLLMCQPMPCTDVGFKAPKAVMCPPHQVGSLAALRSQYPLLLSPLGPTYAVVENYGGTDCTSSTTDDADDADQATSIDGMRADGQCHRLDADVSMQVTCYEGEDAVVRVCLDATGCTQRCSTFINPVDTCVVVNGQSSSGRKLKSSRWTCVNPVPRPSSPPSPPSTQPPPPSTTVPWNGVARTDVWAKGAMTGPDGCDATPSSAFSLSWSADVKCVNQGCRSLDDEAAVTQRCVHQTDMSLIEPAATPADHDASSVAYAVIDMFSDLYCFGDIVQRNAYVADVSLSAQPTCHAVLGSTYRALCDPSSGNVVIRDCGTNANCTGSCKAVADEHSGSCLSLKNSAQWPVPPVFGPYHGVSARFYCTNGHGAVTKPTYPTAPVPPRPSDTHPSDTYSWRIQTVSGKAGCTDEASSLPLEVFIDNSRPLPCSPTRNPSVDCNDNSPYLVTCPNGPVLSLDEAALPTTAPYLSTIDYASDDCDGPVQSITSYKATGECLSVDDVHVMAVCDAEGRGTLRICNAGCETCTSVSHAASNGECTGYSVSLSSKLVCTNYDLPSTPVPPSSTPQAVLMLTRTELWLGADSSSGCMGALPTAIVASLRPSASCTTTSCAEYSNSNVAIAKSCVAPSDTTHVLDVPSSSLYVVLDGFAETECGGERIERLSVLSSSSACVSVDPGHYIQASCDGGARVATIKSCDDSACTKCVATQQASGSCIAAGDLPPLASTFVPVNGKSLQVHCGAPSSGGGGGGVGAGTIAVIIVIVIVVLSVAVGFLWRWYQRRSARYHQVHQHDDLDDLLDDNFFEGADPDDEDNIL